MKARRPIESSTAGCASSELVPIPSSLHAHSKSRRISVGVEPRKFGASVLKVHGF